jgi:hypothetical protein
VGSMAANGAHSGNSLQCDHRHCVGRTHACHAHACHDEFTTETHTDPTTRAQPRRARKPDANGNVQHMHTHKRATQNARHATHVMRGSMRQTLPHAAGRTLGGSSAETRAAPCRRPSALRRPSNARGLVPLHSANARLRCCIRARTLSIVSSHLLSGACTVGTAAHLRQDWRLRISRMHR